MQYVIENSTGKIIETSVEGTDVSRFDTTTYTIIIDPNEYDSDLYYYDFTNNIFVEYDSTTLFQRKLQEKYIRLCKDYNYYIYEYCHYPEGWQNEGEIARKQANECLDDPNSTQEQIDAANIIISKLNSVEEFITVTVQVYFYKKKLELFATTTEAELDAVSWDFTTLDGSDPNVRMTVDIYPNWNIIRGITV